MIDTGHQRDHNSSYYAYGKWKPPRAAVLVVGLVAGIVVGLTFCFAISDYQQRQRASQAPSWQTGALVLRAATRNDGTRQFYLENLSGRDIWYRDQREIVIMKASPEGLTFTEIKPALPAFLPLGEVSSISIEGAEGDCTLFDLARRYKVSLAEGEK